MQEKIIIFGLCNPGKEYERSFHSVGSACIKALLDKENIKMSQAGKYACAKVDNKVFVYSRSEYMNDSGKVLLLVKQQYDFSNENLIVIHDEVMLPLAQVKCTLGGSAKGHNGLRDIMEKIGSNFFRIKVGVGHPGKNHDLGKYLTSPAKPASFDSAVKSFTDSITLDTFDNLIKAGK